VLKKLIAISFCFIYLFTTTELHELIRLPLLIEHFVEHREQNKQITLWQFFYIHYALGDVKDADYGKDMKLPFKSHDNCVAGNTTVFPPSSEKLSLQKPVQFLEKKGFATDERFLPTSFLSKIWQPPRVS
jgi:hypothetical protein